MIARRLAIGKMDRQAVEAWKAMQQISRESLDRARNFPTPPPGLDVIA